jgi:hypothetical protein
VGIGFGSHREHRCLCVVIVVCCQVKVSVTGWSLIQRSATDGGVSECDRDISILKRTWSIGKEGNCALRNFSRKCPHTQKIQILCYYIGFCTLILPRKYLVGRIAYGKDVNWVMTARLSTDWLCVYRSRKILQRIKSCVWRTDTAQTSASSSKLAVQINALNWVSKLLASFRVNPYRACLFKHVPSTFITWKNRWIWLISSETFWLHWAKNVTDVIILLEWGTVNAEWLALIVANNDENIVWKLQPTSSVW